MGWTVVKEFEKHELTILKDDGLYRHLRCQEPKSWMFGFDVVTWPGHLYVGGDIGGYTFARDRDMFEFFGHGRSIDHRYWAQKLTSHDTDPTRFDPASPLSAALDHAQNCGDRDPQEQLSLIAAIRREIPEHWEGGIESAHEALTDFEHDGFAFSDVWEWDFKRYTAQFLLCCEGIVWAIAAYREAKAPKAVAA